MSMPLSVPDELAARLAAAARARGETIEVFVVEALQASPLLAVGSFDDEGDALQMFLGCADSGDADWAARDTADLRREALVRREV